MTTRSMNDEETEACCMIKVEALMGTYGDLKAVDQVSFEIGQGKIVGLLSHNGAGRPTIMK